jgi:ABC-type antimicrobial peptide transport system permease subunit
MAMAFAGVAIFIGCIGLYGLVMYMSKMKTKEVGIRKTLGASVVSIVNIFSWEFTKLLLVAFLLASPLAWWVMNKWLSNYSYQIDLGWQVFAMGLIVTVIIALVTVAHRSIKSALANPVDSLKVE